MFFKRSNRRRADRIQPPASAPVEVQVIGTGHIDVLSAENISASGVGIRVPHRFQGCNLGTEVELVITLPGGRSFKALGVIRHLHSTGKDSDSFGIEFTAIEDKHREQIDTYIESRLQAKDK
jgi:c-di-GMP-binding flagellar brake protein YcgR